MSDMDPLNAIAIVATLAVLGELTLEALKPALDPLFDRLNLPDDINVYLYLSLALGVALALLFHADLLGAVGLQSPYTSALWFQRVITGLLIGRGANFTHDVISRLSDRTGSIKVSTTSPEKSASRTAVTVSTSQEGEDSG